MTFSIADDEEEEKDNSDINYVEEALDRLDVSEDDFRSEMEELRQEYEPLVTQQDALAILAARQFDLDLVQAVKGEVDNSFDIENLVEGMSDVTLRATVQSVGSINQFDGGQVLGITVGDSTGQTQVSFWDEDADEAKQAYDRNDEIRVEGCYTKRQVSDYQQDRFGVPAVQMGDESKAEVKKDDEFIQVIGPD